MANINQASFSKIRKEANRITESYNDIRNSNFDEDDCFEGDCESLWDGMWNLSDLFDECKQAISKVEHMLEDYTNFGTKDDYKEILNELESVRYNIISDYKSIKNAISDFSDSEITRMREFNIEFYI